MGLGVEVHYGAAPSMVKDRRRAKRYPLDLELRFAVYQKDRCPVPAIGRSINLSASGVMFSSPLDLNRGNAVIGAMDWPCRAAEHDPLQFILMGHVVWSLGGWTGVSLSRHEILPAQGLAQARLGIGGSGPAAQSKHRPILEPMVLVEECDDVYTLVWAVLHPRRFVVRRATAQEAIDILKVGFPPVSLVVTRSVDVAIASGSAIPLLFTGTETEAPVAFAVCARAKALNRILDYESMRSALDELTSYAVPRKRASAS